MKTRSATFGATLFIFMAVAMAQSQAGLSATQIEKLLQIHSPDSVVAQEIRSRGISFVPSEKFISGLQQRGAGPQTIAALRERVPTATLEVQALPDTAITIDGGSAGTTDAQGRLVVANLGVGRHDLTAEKVGYRKANVPVYLAAREYRRVPMALDWAGGFLTIKVEPPGSIIDVQGIGRFNGEVSEAQCPAGNLTVSVSHPGFKTETRTIQIATGQKLASSISLVIDPDFEQRGLNEARSRLAHGDTAGAIELCRQIASFSNKNPEVASITAQAYLQRGDLSSFQTYAEQALKDGGSVSVELAHEHLELSGESIHPVTLKISANAVGYDPVGVNCKYGKFEVPVSGITALEVTNKTTSGFMTVRHLGAETFLLHIEARSAGRSDKKITLYFAAPNSRVVRQGNIGYLYSPSNSADILNAIAALVRRTNR